MQPWLWMRFVDLAGILWWGFVAVAFLLAVAIILLNLAVARALDRAHADD